MAKMATFYASGTGHLGFVRMTTKMANIGDEYLPMIEWTSQWRFVTDQLVSLWFVSAQTIELIYWLGASPP
jgi:hypothetical protein